MPPEEVNSKFNDKPGDRFLRRTHADLSEPRRPDTPMRL